MSPWISDTLEALAASLDTLLPEVAPTIVTPGAEVAWDDCGCDEGGGQAWVRLTSSFPSTVFPAQDEEATCGAKVVYQVEVGVLRCFGAIEQDGSLDTSALPAKSRRIVDDYLAMRQAVCALSGTRMAIGAWSPAGPDGNCVGGTLIVNLTNG